MSETASGNGGKRGEYGSGERGEAPAPGQGAYGSMIEHEATGGGMHPASGAAAFGDAPPGMGAHAGARPSMGDPRGTAGSFSHVYYEPPGYGPQPMWPREHPGYGPSPAGFQRPQMYGAPPQSHHCSHHIHDPGVASPVGAYGGGAPWMDLVNDLANGNANPSRLMACLESLDGQFWKGALVGAAATLLFTNETVKSALAGALSGVFGAFQSEQAREKES